MQALGVRPQPAFGQLWAHTWFKNKLVKQGKSQKVRGCLYLQITNGHLIPMLQSITMTELGIKIISISISAGIDNLSCFTTF